MRRVSKMRIIRLATGSSAIVLALITAPRLAMAHPMGNFSINHYSRIVIRPGVLELDYIIDMAEIPTFQETQRSGIKARLDDPLLPNYLERQDQSFKQGFLLMVGGRPLVLRTISRQALFPPGAGGLPTAKLGFVYESTLPAGVGRRVLLPTSSSTINGEGRAWRRTRPSPRGAS